MSLKPTREGLEVDEGLEVLAASALKLAEGCCYGSHPAVIEAGTPGIALTTNLNFTACLIQFEGHPHRLVCLREMVLVTGKVVELDPSPVQLDLWAEPTPAESSLPVTTLYQPVPLAPKSKARPSAPLFKPEQFVPTRFKTAADKARFANHFVRFVEADFPQSLFHDWFYTDLHVYCHFIAHSNRQGFYSEYFTTPHDKAYFLSTWAGGNNSLVGLGEPAFTFSDVEKALVRWLKKNPQPATITSLTLSTVRENLIQLVRLLELSPSQDHEPAKPSPLPAGGAGPTLPPSSSAAGPPGVKLKEVVVRCLQAQLASLKAQVIPAYQGLPFADDLLTQVYLLAGLAAEIEQATPDWGWPGSQASDTAVWSEADHFRTLISYLKLSYRKLVPTP